ncbi:hypothetical protein [Micromonospora sp. NPDC000729]|uniref:hypothetical protein n=1 Tax=Micromonospora sp. NPDC000729 TaxID=3364220 RepID=UPI0036A85900
MAAVEAWFWGGPADGRIMPVEISDASGEPPATVELRQSGFYLGTGDAETLTLEHVYVLADPVDGLAVYRYQRPACERPDNS